MATFRYKLPPYRNIEVDGRPLRAYLVLSADIYGTWSGSYHAWMGDNAEGLGQYVIVPPVIQQQPDISTTLRKLRAALKDEVD